MLLVQSFRFTGYASSSNHNVTCVTPQILHITCIRRQYPPTMTTILPSKLLVWNALASILIRLGDEIRPIDTIISYDTANLELAQTIARSYSNTSTFVVLNLHSEYRGPLWESVFNNPYDQSMSVIVVNNLDAYSRLVNVYLKVLLRQSILICTEADSTNMTRIWSHIRYVAHFGRLLVILWQPVHNTFNMYTWSVSAQKYHRHPDEERLFDRHHPDVQLFWNTVDRMPQPPVFRIDLLPPEHANSCRPTAADPGGVHCYAFGPYVYLARQIANTYRHGYRARMLPYTVGNYDDGYRQLFVDYKLADASVRVLRSGRSTGDGFLQYERTERTQKVNRTRLEWRRDIVLVTMTHGLGQLYPIHYDPVRLIVPRVSAADASTVSPLSTQRDRLALAAAWLAVVLAAATVRLCAARPGAGDFGAMCLHSWALTLGTSGGGALMRNGAAAVQLYVVFVLSVYGVLAGGMFAGDMFQNMMGVQEAPQIESIRELKAHNVTIMAAIELYGDVYKHLQNGEVNRTVELKMPSTRWTTLAEVQQMLSARDRSGGFLLPHSSMGLLRTAWLKRGYGGEAVYHVAKEVVGECVQR